MSEGQVNEATAGDDEDSGVALSKTRLEDAEMDIAPMIDCTFLLLIFFIVCSHVGQNVQVELPKARYGVPVPSKNSVVLTVATGEGDFARVYKGDGIDPNKLFSGGTVAEQEEAISQYVADTMANNDVLEHILIKAARDLKHREVSRVCRAAVRNVEVPKLFVAVMESN